MSSGKRLFIVVRVPKSGSQSLHEMVTAAWPEAQSFNVPSSRNADTRMSWFAKLRRARSLSKRLIRTFGVYSRPAMWQVIEQRARDGDIVSGHIRYGAIHFKNVRPDWITLIRDPVTRALSDYRYTRNSVMNRNMLSRAYQSPRRKAAYRYSFAGYLSFLLEHRDLYGNVMASYVMGDHQGDPVAFMEENYFHYGVLEKIDRFAEELGRKAGRQITVTHRNPTRSSAQVDVTAKELALIEQVYPRDLEIYHRICAHIA